MGLFFRHHHSPQPETRLDSHTKLHVSIRCPDTLPTTTPTWSLVVSESRRPVQHSPNHDNHQQQHPSKSRSSIFSFKGSKDSKIDSHSDLDRHQDESTISTTTTTTITDVHEFTLSSDGNLFVNYQVQPSPRSPTSDPMKSNTGSDSTSGDDNSSGILLKILIPHTTPDTRQPLSTQIESILRQSITTTTSTSTSTTTKSSSTTQPPPPPTAPAVYPPTTQPQSQLDTQSHKSNLTTLLTHLQASPSISSSHQQPILPPPETFSISKFIQYAENNFTFFLSEISSSSTQVVRESDYTAHIQENARLRAHFGHSNNERNGRNGYGGVKNEAHIQGGIGGGWWVSRPMDYHNSCNYNYGGAGGKGMEKGFGRSEREVSRDIYGGLM